jgi:hypothetical protein
LVAGPLLLSSAAEIGDRGGGRITHFFCPAAKLSAAGLLLLLAPL